MLPSFPLSTDLLDLVNALAPMEDESLFADQEVPGFQIVGVALGTRMSGSLD